MIERIRAIESQTRYDFRETSCPDDPLSYLFEEWVPYYRLKYAIARALQPRRIFEIGVRYGYSALAFLNACPAAEYVGTDLDVNAYGGNTGALSWARRQSVQFNATFLSEDSQQLTALPGGFYDLVHVDGQQDGIGTQHDLDLALRNGAYVLLDGFLWTRTNCFHTSDFLLRNKDLIEWSALLTGYAGDLLIKPRREARLQPKPTSSEELRSTYTSDYYTQDCGGYDSFKRTGGAILEEPRLKTVVFLAAAVKRESGMALDLGCGRGEASIALAKAGFRVTAIDYSEAAIVLARQAASAAGMAHRIEFHRADANSFNDSRRYDCAIAADLVEHMDPEELDRLYGRVARTITPSGRFVIHTFPNKWFYQYEYPRRLRAARALNAFLAPEPRSRFELLMHINEQSPRTLRRQLRKHFAEVQLWFSDPMNPTEHLSRRFTTAELRAATDLYTVASHRPLDCNELRSVLTMQPVPEGIEADLRIEIIDCPQMVTASGRFRVQVRVTTGRQYLRSDPPYPVLLSYHWLRPDGSVEVFEGLRTRLEPPVHPGDSESYTMEVLAPAASGSFGFRVTLLQDRVRWFDTAGLFADQTIRVISEPDLQPSPLGQAFSSDVTAPLERMIFGTARHIVHTPDAGRAAVPGLASFRQLWSSPSCRSAVRDRVRLQQEGHLLEEYGSGGQPIFYFLHIPKTAGVSLNRFLQKALGGSPVVTDLWDPLLLAERRGPVPERSLYSGHLHLYLDRFLLRKTRKFVMLRDPVSRTISHYMHVRAAGDHPQHKLSQSLSLYDFCLHPETRHMVENYQARYLVDFGLDPRILATLFTDEELQRFRLQDLLEQCSLGILHDESLLQAAQANLAHFPVVGVTEYMAQSTRRIASLLGVEAPEYNERHNAVVGERIREEELDARTTLAIAEATRIDQALYRRARQQLLAVNDDKRR